MSQRHSSRVASPNPSTEGSARARPPRRRPVWRTTGAAALAVGFLVFGGPTPALAKEQSVVLRMRAKRLAAKGRCEEALPLLTQARAQAPGDARAALLEGQCALELRRYRAAVGPLEDAKRLDPKLTEADLYLTIAYYHTGAFDEAEQSLARAEAVYPEKAPVQLYRGLLLLHRAEATEAAARFERAMAADPDAVEPVASYYLGLAYESANERARAEEALARVRETHPDSVWAMEADQALQRMSQDRAPTFWVTAMMGMEYDDNVVLRGDDIDRPGGVSDDGSFAGIWYFDTGMELFRSGDWSAGVLAAYSGSAYTDASEFDLQSPAVGAWLDKRFGESLLLRTQADYEYTWLDTDDFLSTYGVTSSLIKDLGDARVASGFVRFARYDYLFRTDSSPGPPGVDVKQARNRDGNELTFGLDFSRYLDNKTLASTGFRYRHYDSRGKESDHNGFEFLIGARRQLPWQLAFDLGLSFEYRPYDNPSSFEDPPGSGRFDDDDRNEFSWRVEAALERPINEVLTASLRYTYYNNDSNVRTYDYDRNIVGLYFTVQFPR